MLGVGWTEMLVIGIVALVVIGPKELPTVMHRIGKFAATIRRMGSDFQRELNKTTGLNEIANLRNSVTAPLKATADAIRKEFNTVGPGGEVKPSGAIKPADPKAESVVDEIKAAAGMSPAAVAAPLTGPANPAPAVSPKPAVSTEPAATAESPGPPETKPARVRAPRPPKVTAPAASTPVEVADIPAARKAAKAKKPIESPAPVEAIAPKPRARKAATASTGGVPKTPTARKPAARKPAVKKPAARKPAADEKP